MNRAVSLVILCLLQAFPLVGQRKQNQVSLRVGEPMGFMYKRFLNEKVGLEFGVGTASPHWNERYYKNTFGSYSDFDDMEYTDHSIKDIFYFQGRVTFNRDIEWPEVPGTFSWYWGIGALVKTAKVLYVYDDPDFLPGMRAKLKTDYDVGPEGIIGFEYLLQDIPLSAYTEVGILIEVANAPGQIRGFSAIGIRYNF